MSEASHSPQPKHQKLEMPKVIGTHSGTFHCDEALATYMLGLTKLYEDATVKRSRDPAVLDTCSVVVDVGGVYDEVKQRFDHHQRGFTGVFGHGFNTKLSSAGLVYKHFGKEIIANVLHLSESDPKVDLLWLRMYKEFIEAVDAHDNGISQYSTDIPPLYRNRTNLSNRVAAFNPAWNEPSDAQTYDAQFAKASKLAGEEFLSTLNSCANAWLPARDLVVEAVAQSRADLDPSGRIILLKQFCPWKEHLHDLEKTPNSGVVANAAIYVVYPDETVSNWRIQAVPTSPESFASRKALPEAWCGLRDAELSRESGIEGCIFVHASGFTGGNKTKEGALKMARLALDM